MDDEKLNEILLTIVRMEGTLNSLVVSHSATKERVGKLESRLNGNGNLGLAAWVVILKYGGLAVALILLGIIAPAIAKKLGPLVNL